MGRDSAIAVIAATLIAIGVALGVTMSGSTPNEIDDFEQIFYVRDVEHGKLALLGDCPLEREIIVEGTGKARISWYAQQPDHHGCVRAMGLVSDWDDEKRWDEPKVARIEQRLSPARVKRLVDELERLAWEVEWTAPVDLAGTYSTGCERTIYSFPDRQLGVTKSGPRVATLNLFSEKARGNATCIANDMANKARLDAAFSSFAPLLPSKYELRPEVAKRLYRK